MKVEHVEFLVEDRSTEALLRLLLPRMIGNLSHAVYPFEGKTDLLAKLPHRLRGYAAWLPPEHRIVIVVDQDDEDCRVLKRKLEAFAQQAGLPTRARAHRDAVRVIPRIACEELEAWYFGDWSAVCTAYPRVPTTIPSKKQYRAPDDIRGGTWESFERVLQQAGYFPGGLAKIEAARAIAPHMVPARNTSPSFRALRDALQEL